MWIDIVFFAIIILFASIGLWKGLIDSILSLVGTGLAFGLAIWLAKPAAGLLNKIINLPNMFTKLLDKAFNGQETIDIWGNALQKEDVSAFLSIIFSGIVVFLLVKLAIWLLSKLFNGVASSTSIGSGLNRTLGLIFGIAEGGVIVCILLAICSLITGTQVVGNKIDNAIDNTKVTKWVYNYVDDFTEKTLNKVDMKEFLKNLVKEKEDEPAGQSLDAPVVEYTIEIPQGMERYY